MSCLKRRDEAEVPSTLFESISTGSGLAAFDVGKPWMLPMKAVNDRLANGPVAGTPIAMLLLAVMVPLRALWPIATLSWPVVQVLQASSPTPTFSEPVVTLSSASSPKAELPKPVVAFNSAKSPKALFWPTVLLKSASRPWAFWKFASALLKSAKAPTALLAPPVLLNVNAPAPSAQLLFPFPNASAPAPTPVLFSASVCKTNACQPFAVLNVLLNLPALRAWNPSQVLLPLKTSGFSGAARICGKSTKQASTDRIAPNIIFRLFMFLICPFIFFGLP